MSSLRVLLVDDEPLALHRLSALFGDLGGREVAGVARNGREAAERVAASRADLVTLDIQLP